MIAANEIKTWLAKVPVFTGLFALVVLFGGFVVWETVTQIAGEIISPGRIEVDQNRQIVQHQTGGKVARIYLMEGDVVNSGDVLLRLNGQQLQSQLAISEGKLFELMAWHGRLTAERDTANIVTFDEVLLSEGAANPNINELIEGQAN